MKLYNNVNDVNRQLQVINHIKIYSTENPEKLVTVIFVIQNMIAMVEIQYNIHDKHPTKISIFPRLTTNIFQKIFNNNGGVLAQVVVLKKKIEKDEEEEFNQYYFIDSKNKIQILYPNYDQKVERVKIIE